jgi:uncharacterized protein
MAKNQKEKPFSLLVKPASADCNLNCTYCFYLDKSSLYPETPKHRMSDEVLETMIAGYMRTLQPAYSFGWQGGEPTLMGLEFFQKAVSFQQKYGRPRAVVANGLQTNATLIDDAMADLFARYKFLLGVSLDGPEELHNVYRKNKQGAGTHDRVLRGLSILKKHNVEFNILVLVSSANVEHPEKVYQYLCDHGFYYHQYIPCVEFDEQGKPLPWTITGEQWGRFLNSIYDQWSDGDIRKVSVRHFDAVLQYLVNNQYIMCTMGRNCRQYFVVEHNGDVYPCDFFVERDLKLGNIMHESWKKFASSKRYRDFGRQKAMFNPRCRECPYVKFCAGDCLKHRLPLDGDPKTLSWLCEGWYRFYEHSLSGLKRIAAEISSGRSA